MALLKKIVKVNHRDVVVKWTGSGADTLTLASLVASGQTVTGTPAADILSAQVSVSAAGLCTITRNAEVTLNATDGFSFQADGIYGAVLSENSGSSIDVNLSQPGTLILRLRKTQGYSDPTL